MKERRGLPGGQYKPITEQEILKIHETSLRVLSEVGVQVNFTRARELFIDAGARAEGDANVVKIPPALVEDLIQKAPSVVYLCGRAENGALDCEIGGKNVYLGTGGTALNVQDPGKEDSRRATLEDVVDMRMREGGRP